MVSTILANLASRQERVQAGRLRWLGFVGRGVRELTQVCLFIRGAEGFANDRRIWGDLLDHSGIPIRVQEFATFRVQTKGGGPYAG